MALTPRRRWLILGGALAVTLALVVWVGEAPEEPAARPPSAARSAPGEAQTAPAKAIPADPGSLKLGRADRGLAKGEIRDLFPRQTWFVPPPPAPAGPPQPPPLPFTYLGRLIDDGQVTVYLEDDEDRNLAVRQGDVINGIYRVKRISPAAVTFVYLPMNKQQTLDIGSPQ